MVTWVLILILQDPATGQTVKQHIPAASTQARCLQIGKDAEARWHKSRPEIKTYSQCVPVPS